jgi:hypothetical protein
MEAVVYVHGIVGREYGSHRADYSAFRNGLTKQGVALPELTDSVLVEWGWPAPAAQETGLLAQAQQELGSLVEAARQRDTWTRPLMRPLRELVFYGWADIAYYLDNGGKEHARNVVWTSILRSYPTDASIDLTFIGHSAGSLLLHDFLFFLFSGSRDHVRDKFARNCDWEGAARNWRVRRVVSLGSPLTPLLVRSSHLVRQIAAGPGPWLEARDIGFDRAAYDGSLPIWLNVWDRHDILSYPVEGVYDAPGRIRDLFPDHSDRPDKAHNRYWSSSKVHKALAEHWNA